MKTYYLLFLYLIFQIMPTCYSYAFDSDFVHSDINKYASGKSTLYLFVQEYLGYADGIAHEFNGKKIEKWIRIGGQKEDDGIRFLNHFHDPLKPFETAGLWGTTSSSLAWAQNSENNDASWAKARQLFYDALTTGSEESYANLFLTIGQLTHLVSDKAVPAHIRDDAHPETVLSGRGFNITHFEVWTKEHHDNAELMGYAHGIRPDATIFNNYQPTSLAPSPIARLWDTNQYLGNNPEVTLNKNIGLAEFTNANFFSCPEQR